ncbi:hypothetical protein D3C78_1963860 [compost metagenome]
MQLGNRLEQRWRIADEGITENMNGGATPGAGQLDAIDQLHIQRLSRGTRLL